MENRALDIMRFFSQRWSALATLILLSTGCCLIAVAGDLRATERFRAAAGQACLLETLARCERIARSTGADERAWAARAFADPDTVISVGTGWPLETGYVVTNNHVVSGSDEVVLVDQAGNEMAAWPVLRDELHDIALLEVRDAAKLPPALPLAAAQEGEGASVFTIGFPRPESPHAAPQRSSGVISALAGLNADPNTYQTTVAIQPGNSGGPLLNMRGEVVGVVTAMLAYQHPGRGTLEMVPNASCARKIRCVTELFTHLPEGKPKIRTLPNRAADLESLSARIRSSVLIVVARPLRAGLN